MPSCSKSLLFASAAVLAAAASPARAQSSAPAATTGSSVSEVVVTARRLDAARQTVAPSLGASTYSLSKQVIDILPGGENLPLNQVILQAPGVVQDSFGQLHVRGDHGDLQYRLNNVILPEGISVFGQTLSPRLAGNIDLITGALPAQYGLRTAGIVAITTKNGFQNGGEVGIYGGSHGEIEPSGEYGGTWGSNSLFVSGSFQHTGVGIESPDGSAEPLHDASDQLQLFGYFDHILGPSDRLSLIVGTSQQTFQIPNQRGLHPDFPNDPAPVFTGNGLVVNGVGDFLSDDLDERQREATTFAIVSLQHTGERFTGQASLFSRYSTLSFQPDPVGDLLFTGIAQQARKSDTALGIQLEGVYDLTPAHTLRAGVIVQGDRSTSRTASQVLPVDANGAQTTDVPIAIVDDGAKTAWTGSGYLQDEWKAVPGLLTLNFGIRYDRLESYRQEDQWSPRANLVLTPLPGTTLHAGYARYFTPPPFELIANPTVQKFNGTTAQFPNPVPGALPFSERSDYFDLGAQQKLGPVTLGVDAYYKDVRHLLDEGQFGSPIVLTPFNYAKGYIRGADLSASYAKGPLSAYLNLGLVKGQGKGIESQEFNFDPADLAYISGHYIYLDHIQTVTASAGASYRLGATHIGGDLLFGTGLRRDGAVPNGDHLPAYAQVNLSIEHRFDLAPLGPLSLRLDLINAFDARYEIRDGTGVGVGAPQWGPRRGVFVGLTKSF
jgi:outer membrane receptor protein involved in Fe transport